MIIVMMDVPIKPIILPCSKKKETFFNVNLGHFFVNPFTSSNLIISSLQIIQVLCEKIIKQIVHHRKRLNSNTEGAVCSYEK